MERIKPLKGQEPAEINDLILSIHEEKDHYAFFEQQPVLFWRSRKPLRVRFWRWEWDENEEGDDLLILHDEENPVPFQYHIENSGGQKYISYASRYTGAFLNISKDIHGYGCTNTKDEPFLGEILIDRGDRFIQFISNAAMEIHIPKQPPELFYKMKIF